MSPLHIKQYVVDAFTDKVFGGNPAAIIVRDEWLDEELMQSITLENNLSETAFAVKLKNEAGPSGENLYHLRWFTPGGEIDLCGHATLATAFVVLNYVEKNASQRVVSFQTRSGILTVQSSDGKLLEMDFPCYELHPVPVTPAMTEALGVAPLEAVMGRDLVCVLPDEHAVRTLQPDTEKVRQLDGVLCHVTAKATTSPYDCVSRTFAPKHAVAEDPVCGSGHCHIAPFWSARLGKNTITAYQASKRGGTLFCDVSQATKRVKLSGNAALFCMAELQL